MAGYVAKLRAVQRAAVRSSTPDGFIRLGQKHLPHEDLGLVLAWILILSFWKGWSEARAQTEYLVHQQVPSIAIVRVYGDKAIGVSIDQPTGGIGDELRLLPLTDTEYVFRWMNIGKLSRRIHRPSAPRLLRSDAAVVPRETGTSDKAPACAATRDAGLLVPELGLVCE